MLRCLIRLLVRLLLLIRLLRCLIRLLRCLIRLLRCLIRLLRYLWLRWLLRRLRRRIEKIGKFWELTSRFPFCHSFVPYECVNGNTIANELAFIYRTHLGAVA